MQWGCAEGSPVAYPIAFTLICYIVRNGMQTSSSAGQAYERGVFAVTKTNFSRIFPSPQQSYIAIGIQQWGATTPVGRGSRTVNFHLTFPTQVYILLKTGFGVSPYADTLSYAYGTVAAITTTSFKMFEGNVDTVKQCSWLAFGVQQWGYESSFNGGAKLSFPISFSNTTYTITGSSWDSLQIYCPKFTGKETTQCTMNNGIGHVSYNGTSALDWVAIGIQQWGNSSSNTFPVSFTNTDWKMAGLMTSSHYDYTSAVISKSQNGFQNGSWGNPYDYIVIGMQQWGLTLPTTSSGEDVFVWPITFSSINYFAISNPLESGATGSGWGYAYDKSTSSCKFVVGNVSWDAFGIGF